MSVFNITKDQFGCKTAIFLFNTETGEHAQILPFYGGALNSLALRTQHGLLEVIDGYPTAETALSKTKKSFKGSSLFPFPNRIDQGKYRFDDQDFQLPVNFPHEKNAIHGLIFDKQFEIVSEKCAKDHCSVRLIYAPKTGIAGYPFMYRLEHSYSLDILSTLHCVTTIKNLEKSTIPVGHGWHPYFQFGRENVQVNELYLQSPAHQRLILDDRNLPTCELETNGLFSRLKQIAQAHLDDCFALPDIEGVALTTLTHPGLNLCLQISQTTGKRGYNYCQIYTPSHRSSIAIEPMTCAPNAFNNGMGLILLQPQESISLCWSVRLKTL